MAEILIHDGKWFQASTRKMTAATISQLITQQDEYGWTKLHQIIVHGKHDTLEAALDAIPANKLVSALTNRMDKEKYIHSESPIERALAQKNVLALGIIVCALLKSGQGNLKKAAEIEGKRDPQFVKTWQELLRIDFAELAHEKRRPHVRKMAAPSTLINSP